VGKLTLPLGTLKIGCDLRGIKQVVRATLR
jgi:hypothetical protein